MHCDDLEKRGEIYVKEEKLKSKKMGEGQAFFFKGGLQEARRRDSGVYVIHKR